MSKEQTPMNWTKRQIQGYGIFCAFLGLLIGISASMMWHIWFTYKH